MKRTIIKEIMEQSEIGFWFVDIASPQQGDLRLSCPSSGQDVRGGARTHKRMVPAVLRADSPSPSESQRLANHYQGKYKRKWAREVGIKEHHYIY
ncbi:hypothetical protein PoB_003667000 [Plakobranchus ocellatus]|uniref:Uncharacterized protein n=1 Tax=Plakobranchus ocellatus TaxID=259542 RepID=A0AAV4APH9_9GAST|nr:hypothetical protein PoB_003667000 [Plakobranchus ocellatus]